MQATKRTEQREPLPCLNGRVVTDFDKVKGIGTKVELRECPDCVADAAEFLEEQFNW